MDPYDPYLSYYAARTGLIGVVALVALPMMFVSCFLVRTRKDPARRGFFGLHLAWILLFLSTILSLATGILVCLQFAGLDRDMYWNSDSRAYIILHEAQDSLSIWGLALNLLAVIAVIATIVEVGLGLLKRFKTGAGGRRVVRFILYPAVVILAVITIAYLGWFQAYIHRYWWGSEEDRFLGIGGENERARAAWIKVYVALQILLMIVYAFVVAFCIHLVVVAGKMGAGKSVAGLLLSASILMLIENIFEAALSIRFTLLNANGSWVWTQPVDAIFSFWFTMVALILIFVAGRKKMDGLWTTTQTFSVPVHQAYGNGGGYTAYPTYPQQHQGYGVGNGYRVS